MNYDETILYLYNLQKFGIKLGLENIRNISEIFNNPQGSYQSIHIAGTNGKGSTAIILQSILTEDGLKTGLFTSPHLVRFTERIKINRTEISQEDVIYLTSEIRNAILELKGLNPTFFEIVTAIAFLYFRKNNVDWAIFETGMGGRLDATNILLPEISIITSIGEDHKEFLGSSITDIATEKAGIIKPNTPVITTAKNKDALKVITEAAEKNSSPLYVYGRDFEAFSIKSNIDGTTFNYRGEKEFYNISIPLTGTHQAVNAASAIMAWEHIKSRNLEVEKLRSFTDSNVLRNALRKMRWPGRCELVDFRGIPVLLDGAHNPEAIFLLANTLSEIYINQNKKSFNSLVFTRIILIFGAMSDKDIKEMLKKIIPISDEVVFTAPFYGRAENPENLKRTLASYITDHKRNMKIIIRDNVKDALSYACNSYHSGDLIVVTGSFYIVGEAKEAMGEKTLLKDLREYR